MSEAIITVILTQLASIIEKQIRQELRLVVGVDRDIRNLTSNFDSIKAVLVDAEKRQVKEETVKVWLQKLRDVTYDMDDVLAEWSTAILKIQIEGLENTTPKKKVCSFITFPCFCFSRVVLRRDIALKIKDLHERLDVIAAEKDRYNFRSITSTEGPERLKTTSHVDVPEVRGRDGDKTTLVKELLKESRQGDRGLHIISIVGMGGVGKTTLAQLAYHCDDVTSHFEIRMWVCVSDPFDEVRVGKAIVEDVRGNAPNLFELETVLRHLRNSITGKKFLLVLDDVWTEDYRKWEPLRSSLKSGASGSKVLVTTRNERVAKMMGSSYMLRLGELSEQDCWSLFSQIAFFERSKKDREALEDTGRKIANKCKGLPLAAKAMGSLMRFKNSLQDWQNVLKNDLWGLEGAETALFPPLLLSYYDLSSALKTCFSYCANFPKDYKIEADNLIKLWMAQGYLSSRGNLEMEATGREYLDDLIKRCFFQDLEKDKDSDNIVRFKMHDMVHDLAQYLTRNECYVMEMDAEVVNRMSSSCSKARHLTLVRAEEVLFPVSTGSAEKLHSFWVQSFYDCPPLVSEVDSVSPDFFNQLPHLKALDLSRNRLRELPRELGKLMNLRYLNLSHNPLWELPETVCELYNLQTLKLVACDHLLKLPQEIGRLINLRHLENDRTDCLKTLPKGIGRLCSLQTLNKFVIASSRDAEETMCKIGDLKDLNQLRGSLKIEGLGHVANVGDAEKA